MEVPATEDFDGGQDDLGDRDDFGGDGDDDGMEGDDDDVPPPSPPPPPPPPPPPAAAARREDVAPQHQPTRGRKKARTATGPKARGAKTSLEKLGNTPSAKIFGPGR